MSYGRAVCYKMGNGYKITLVNWLTTFSSKPTERFKAFRIEAQQHLELYSDNWQWFMMDIIKL